MTGPGEKTRRVPAVNRRRNIPDPVGRSLGGRG